MTVTGSVDYHGPVRSSMGFRTSLWLPVSCYVSSSSPTTISEIGTYYKAAGTTTQVETNANWTHSSNRLTYVGPLSIKAVVRAMVTSTCSLSNQRLRFRIVKNASPTATASVATTVRRTIGTGTDYGACGVEGVFSMSANDYIELWVANGTSGSGTITVNNMHFVAIANLP